MRLARNPKDKEIVGADGVVKLLAANLMPRVSEKLGAKQMHATIEKGAPAGDSHGAVLESIPEGTGISGGNRENAPGLRIARRSAADRLTHRDPSPCRDFPRRDRVTPASQRALRLVHVPAPVDVASTVDPRESPQVHSHRVNIADMPVDERPRERMIRGGAAVLSDAELLALLIEPGWTGRSSLDIGRELVADGLLSVARREWIPGKPVGSLGPSRVARIGAALELGRRIAALRATTSDPVCDPAPVARRLMATYGHRVQETFGAIYLDSRNRIVSEREIYIGTLTTSAVSARDVFRLALHDHAAAVIVFHNHPSGDPSPSPQDLAFTSELRSVGSALDVEILDHLIVARNGYVSFRERGLMRRPSLPG